MEENEFTPVVYDPNARISLWFFKIFGFGVYRVLELNSSNIQQTFMELDGFWFSIIQFQQFSNYLLLVGGPRVKQIIITPTKKSSKFCKVSKTVMSSRHIKKTEQLCMHKTVALREESKIFKGNQLTLDD